jgi:hypothetical protein
VARGVRIVGMVILGVIGAAVFALAFGYFVKLLWNWLMPAIFGLGLITYWQAFGIVILGKLIFGNIGGGMHRNEGRHGRGPWDRDHERSREWQGDWRGFWSEEGREAFRRYTERKRAEKSGEGSESGPESADPVV